MSDDQVAAVSAEWHSNIRAKIKEIEIEEKAQILLAVESGTGMGVSLAR